MKVVIVSGGFDPIHIGHIRMFREARKLGQLLVAILNKDAFLERKKGYIFMPFKERKEVLESIKYINYVFESCDDDNSVCNSLRALRKEFTNETLVFANGGDRKYKVNIPETKVCEELKIEMVFGVGGSDKPQSSSWLVEKERK